MIMVFESEFFFLLGKEMQRVSMRGTLWVISWLALALGAWGCVDSAGTGTTDPIDQADESGGDSDLETVDLGGDDHDDESDADVLNPCGSLEPCGAICCEQGQICVAGSCQTPACDGVWCGDSCCTEGFCEAGSCVLGCSDGRDACDGQCCATDQACDQGDSVCRYYCSGGSIPCGGACCGSDEHCEEGICRATCGPEETRCGEIGSEICCASSELCEAGACVPDCGVGVRCGQPGNQVCCEATEVCEEDTCKIPCEGTRCGAQEELCCTGSDACLFEACTATWGACQDNYDCAIDEFCELSQGLCVKAADDPNQCVYIPPVGEFSPAQEWIWSASDFVSASDQVMMTPVVINTTDDNGDGRIDEEDTPDVVFATFTGSNYNGTGVIRVVSGDSGAEIAHSNAANFSARSDLGAADVDGDGIPEIVVGSANNTSPMLLYFLNVVEDGSGGHNLIIKDSIAQPSSYESVGIGTTAAFADLEGDGSVEVITQFGITNSDFTQRCVNGNWWFAEPADLNGDGIMEIVSNGQIYDNQCNLLATGVGGRGAVADLLPDAGADDLVPELVWVQSGYVDGTVNIVNVTIDDEGNWHQEIVSETLIPLNYDRIQVQSPGLSCTTSSTNKLCNTGGGPVTVADFDGDGQPEIGLAARWYYIVIESDGTILWADSQTKDFSSAVTGSSVFDFEGDGAAEVVYNDEHLLRVYKGSGSQADADGDGYHDAEVIFSVGNPSGTLFEYPLIVDVDNDGNAEIVVAANNYTFPGEKGIRVFGDPLDNWVRTRRIWNQHTYHVTNINEDGSVPVVETMNWLSPGLNNYRQNVQPGGLFNAPNLVAGELSFNHSTCPGGIELLVEVSNQGSLGVPAGLWVSFYAIDLPAPNPTALLGRVQLPQALAPGESTVLSFIWNYDALLLPASTPTTLTAPLTVTAKVDDPEDGVGGENGVHNECVESDNISAAALIAECPPN